MNANPLSNASTHFSFYGQPYRQAGPFTLGFGRLLTLLQLISQDCFLLLCQCLELIVVHSSSIRSGNDTEGSLFMGIVFISKEESYESIIHRLSWFIPVISLSMAQSNKIWSGNVTEGFTLHSMMKETFIVQVQSLLRAMATNGNIVSITDKELGWISFPLILQLGPFYFMWSDSHVCSPWR